MRNSIRTQLILTFLLVVMLSLSGLSIMQLIAGTKSAQEDVNRQLTTAVSFKGLLMGGWVNTLKAELGATLSGEYFKPNIPSLISSETGFTNRQKVILRNQMDGVTTNSRYFEEMFLVDLTGNVVVSTLAESEGIPFKDQQLVQRSKIFPSVSAPVYHKEDTSPALYAGYPVRGTNGKLAGILVGQTKRAPLLDVFNNTTGLREPAQTYLLDLQGRVVAGNNLNRRGETIEAVRTALMGSSPAMMEPLALNYPNQQGSLLTSAYLRLPDLQGVLLVEQISRDVRRTRAATLAVNLSVTLSSVLIAIFIALMTTRSIANPLSDLVDITAQISESAGKAALAQGLTAPGDASANLKREPGPLHTEAKDLDERTRYWSNETGILAQAFSQMTLQLSSLIAHLEDRVSERTAELEQRTRFLEASADVSRASTLILDPGILIPQAVELIRDRFDLYYVGLFLSDFENEWAVLRAGTGAPGQAMLSRQHRLRIEPTSMIGWCITNDQPRVAQTASEDEVRMVNPELPETRSEAAIPLHARGQVIGALTVQSRRPAAFTAAGISALQTMADQLAIALDNAELFARSQQALEAERRAYANQTQTEWSEWLKTSSKMSVRGDTKGISFTSGSSPALPGLVDFSSVGTNQLSIPIRVRGQTIGLIRAGRGKVQARDTSHPGGWGGDEVLFLETIAEQLGVALDGARLYAETRKRAEQERMVDELTGKMRATLDIQTVLETAAREMRDALRLAEVEVRLGEPEDSTHRVADGREGERL